MWLRSTSQVGRPQGRVIASDWARNRKIQFLSSGSQVAQNFLPATADPQCTTTAVSSGRAVKAGLQGAFRGLAAPVPGPITVIAGVKFNTFGATTFSALEDNTGAIIYSSRETSADVSPSLIVTESSFVSGVPGQKHLWFGTDTDATARGRYHSQAISLGVRYVVAGRVDQNDVSGITLWLNGGVDTASGSFAGSFSWAWSGTGAVGYHNNWPSTGNDGAPTEIDFCAVFASALSDDDIRTLSSSQKQLFASTERRIWVGPTTVSGVPVLSLATVIDVTGTSARPRVTITF